MSGMHSFYRLVEKETNSPWHCTNLTLSPNKSYQRMQTKSVRHFHLDGSSTRE